MAEETDTTIEIHQISELNLSVPYGSQLCVPRSQYGYMKQFKFRIFGCHKTCPSVIE